MWFTYAEVESVEEMQTVMMQNYLLKRGVTNRNLPDGSQMLIRFGVLMILKLLKTEHHVLPSTDMITDLLMTPNNPSRYASRFSYELN